MENCWKDPVTLQDQWAVICYLNHGELQLFSYLSGIWVVSDIQGYSRLFWKDNSILLPEATFSDCILQIRLKREEKHPKGEGLHIKHLFSLRFHGTKLWRITFLKQWWSIGGRWPGCHAGWSCLHDKATASVSGEMLPTLTALWGESTRIRMCTGGVTGGYHIWQHLSDYLLPPSQRGTRNKTAALRCLSGEFANNFPPWGGIFLPSIFKQHLDVISHRRYNFNAHHTVYQLSVKLLP